MIAAGCGGSDAPAAPVQPPATPTPAPAPGPAPAPAPAPGPAPAPTPPPAGPDTSAPTAPTSLAATAVSTVAVRLTWSASTDNVGVTGYRVLRDGSPIGTATSPSFNDSGLTPGVQYGYAVIAFDAAGNVSAASAASRVTMPTVTGNVVQANPGNYLSLLPTLRAGDTMMLAAGTYDNPASVPGLPLFDINGAPGNPIIITGPASGAPAVFLGRSTHNTVRLANASHIVLRNFEIDGRNQGAAGIATQGLAHNITIENLRITGVGDDQQTVGISTVGSTVWNWIIRRNVIEGAGTGIYFGNSDGRSPFIAGIIENNLIRDTLGYNMQIKHQLPRPTNIAGMPTTPQKTIIRNNVFSKSANSSTGGLARPNLLVGHFPTSGPGVDDQYEIYGNFFWQNPTEALFQGEGNVAFYGQYRRCQRQRHSRDRRLHRIDTAGVRQCGVRRLADLARRAGHAERQHDRQLRQRGQLPGGAARRAGHGGPVPARRDAGRHGMERSGAVGLQRCRGRLQRWRPHLHATRRLQRRRQQPRLAPGARTQAVARRRPGPPVLGQRDDQRDDQRVGPRADQRADSISACRCRTGIAKAMPVGCGSADSLVLRATVMLITPTTAPVAGSYSGLPLLPG